MKKWLRTSGNYLKWHYTEALFSTFAFWENIFLFLFNYYSIKNLALHLFSPYKREVDPSKFKNLLKIILGFIIRICIILVGVIVCGIYIVLLPLSLTIWLLLPLFVIWLIGYGIILIIFS